MYSIKPALNWEKEWLGNEILLKMTAMASFNNLRYHHNCLLPDFWSLISSQTMYSGPCIICNDSLNGTTG